jgi:DNA-binding NarL/FixJ family response regulator
MTTATERGPTGRKLTEREREVLRLVALGWRNRDIARELTISLRTVEHTVERIRVKLGAPNRTAAATLALQQGVLEPPRPN